MQKIPTLFVRDPEDRRYITEQVTPGCEWVLAGEGVATRKWDGTCVMRDAGVTNDLGGGRWWARREVKRGKHWPNGYVPISTDAVTGKTVGWEPIEQSPFAKVFASVAFKPGLPGTYELCGPKINGNPEGYPEHRLLKHDQADVLVVDDALAPFTPTEIKNMVRHVGALGWEGIVWCQGSRYAKLKVRDVSGGLRTLAG